MQNPAIGEPQPRSEKQFANAFKETATHHYNLFPTNNGFHAGQTDEERMGQRGGPGFTRRAANLPAHQRRVQRCGHCAQLQPNVDALHERVQPGQ